MSDSQWMQDIYKDKLMSLFFQDSPIRVEWEYPGTQRVEGNVLVFGPYAGPERCPTHVIYEMCHLVEIDDARILRNAWGLDMPMQYIPGRYSRMCPVPTTWQATRREIRVISLAWQVQNLLGMDISIRESIDAMRYMPDWCYVPSKTSLDKSSSKEYDEGRYETCEEYLKQCIETKYSLDFFFLEWYRKNELLRKAKHDSQRTFNQANL